MVDNPAISDTKLVVMINIHRVICNSATKLHLHARQRKTVLTRLISLRGVFSLRGYNTLTTNVHLKYFVFAAALWRSGVDNIQMTNSQEYYDRDKRNNYTKSSKCNHMLKISQKMIHKTMKKTIDNEFLATLIFLHTLERERYKIKMHGPMMLFLILPSLTLLMPVRVLFSVKPLNCFSTKITKHN